MNEKNKKSDGVINSKMIRALIAVTAAIVLWFYINGGSSELIKRNITDIPVTFVGEEALNDKGYRLETNGVEVFVNCVLQGTEQNLKNVDVSTFTATVDVSEIQNEGSQSLSIVLQGLPNTIILQDMKPKAVDVEIVAYTDRRMPVQVVPCGSPAEGFTLKSAQAEEQVRITGTSTELKRIDHVEGLTYINGLDSDSVQYVMPLAYDDQGQVVEDVHFWPEWVGVVIKLNSPKTE